MDCRLFRETFSDHLDGLLDEAAQAGVRAHLAVCPSCRRMERAYRTGVAALQGHARVQPPRAFAARVLHRVRLEPAQPSPVGAYGVAGALLAVAALGILALDVQDDRRLHPPAGLAMEAAAPPRAPDEDPLDVITLRLRDDLIDIPAAHPFLTGPGDDSPAVSRLHFEIPAVWPGR